MENFIKIFKALSDKTRLRIYLLLLEGELCVCELVDIMNMEQSRISHSLRVLKEAGLVNNKRVGTWIIYSANPDMLKNKVIQGIKHELVDVVNDSNIINKYRKNKAKNKCNIKLEKK